MTLGLHFSIVKAIDGRVVGINVHHTIHVVADPIKAAVNRPTIPKTEAVNMTSKRFLFGFNKYVTQRVRKAHRIRM